MRSIQAAILTEPNTPFKVVQAELMPPKTGEVQVKIAASGVCHSDWHVVTGDTKHPMPCITGHEGAGVVVAVGEGVNRIKMGDHVTLSWTPDCGECFYCQHGQPNLCETYTEPIWQGVMLDGTPRLYWNGEPVYHYCGLGTFSEYITIPEQSCIPIDKDIPLKVAALVGCAVATGVGAALYTAHVQPGESVAVYGAGGVGLNVIQGAVLAGATTIIAIDTNQEKMLMAKAFGATHTLIAGNDTVKTIQSLTHGRGADHVFESVGLARLQEEGLEATRPGGKLTLVGLSPMGTPTNLPGAVLTRTEKTVKGSYYGSVSPKRDFPNFLEMYRAGRLKLDELISREYRLDQINEAYADMLSGQVARGIIVFD
ncbi:Zn-dependent alcohol dehydrogenase [Phototrophicus methaneseepsis]|uniref:Zn-dependent alcohol dehydrogenase n=1 Tax=Phototrophicus methaneseepsis TaxID=2710758 RepID=A0A7S8EAB1_9CHLR|nr:Zn-dependent alcohol dehydrogenase [Phototrophicus methaneseepsis]QPC83244.1 Zn-dependent alcohol dehydrogenase [Phototrophicus methaneseepsis]